MDLLFSRSLGEFELQEVPPTTRCAHDVVKIANIVHVGVEIEVASSVQTTQTNDGYYFHLEIVAQVFHTPRPVWLVVSWVLLFCCAGFSIRYSVIFSSPASACTQPTDVYGRQKVASDHKNSENSITYIFLRVFSQGGTLCRMGNPLIKTLVKTDFQCRLIFFVYVRRVSEITFIYLDKNVTELQ